MRHLIAYMFWNKRDMIHLVMAGIAKTYNSVEDHIVFVFDGCTDGSVEVFENTAKKILPEWNMDYIVSEKEYYEWHHTANLQKMCLDGGYDSLHFFHDDTLIVGDSFRYDVEKVMNQYGNKLGIIGGREGFIYGYVDGYGSYWSHYGANISNEDYNKKGPIGNISHTLHAGEIAEIRFVNNGPIVYPLKTLKKLGVLDTNFKFFRAEEDYCFRCYEAGLQNIILGTEMCHIKLGRVDPSKIYDDKVRLEDTKLLEKKWGR